MLVNNAGISHAAVPGTAFTDIKQTNLITSAPLEAARKVWEMLAACLLGSAMAIANAQTSRVAASTCNHKVNEP